MMQLYEKTSRITPGLLFRAALADLPVGRRCLEKQFKENSMSLGNAFIKNVGMHFHITQPVAQVFGTCFELSDVCSEDDAGYIKSVIQGFAQPDWRKFEELAGVAPALRLAAMSHHREMEFDFRGEPLLFRHLFGATLAENGAFSTSQARQTVCRNIIDAPLKVACRQGPPDVHRLDLNTYVEKSNTSTRLTLISMNRDSESTFDHFLLVPMQDGTFVTLCIDSKFREPESRGDKHLKFGRDVQVKLQHLCEHKSNGFFPKGCNPVVVIVTNRVVGKKFLTGKKITEPLIVCGRQHLDNLFSPVLVPPTCRH